MDLSLPQGEPSTAMQRPCHPCPIYRIIFHTDHRVAIKIGTRSMGATPDSVQASLSTSRIGWIFHGPLPTVFRTSSATTSAPRVSAQRYSRCKGCLCRRQRWLSIPWNPRFIISQPYRVQFFLFLLHAMIIPFERCYTEICLYLIKWDGNIYPYPADSTTAP